MKKILLPTDFSKNSLSAIDYAMELFKDEPCQFFVLNIQKASSFVSDDFMTMSSSTTIYQTLIDTAKKSLENVIRTVKAHYNNEKHTFESRVDYDNFIDAIVQMCETHDIDLIVMGTQGATGAEKIMFGSNTVRVMQRCSTPVLAIPEGCKYNGLDTIGFTSDYHYDYKPQEMGLLLELAEKHQSKLQVLHFMDHEELSETQKEMKARLDEILLKLPHEFVGLTNGNMFEAVKTHLLVQDVKLLAMMRRKHSFLERLFTTHPVETFGFHIKTPFLVIENTAERL